VAGEIAVDGKETGKGVPARKIIYLLYHGEIETMNSLPPPNPRILLITMITYNSKI
jgi:hypothetical protein